jgi:diguanylate cyclase (GGDEF)-like protein
MFRVLECVWTQHDHWTVGLAALIWVVGSMAFFLALARAQECSANRRNGWLAAAGAAGGLGVWATHFVAMLAYDGGVSVAYEPSLTALSAAISVAAFWAAARVLGGFGLKQCLLAGGVLAVGVAAMHFTGMAALEAAARVRYDWPPVIAGATVSFGLFAASFAAFQRFSGFARVIGGAAPAILAVCILHFNGMASTLLVPDASLPSIAPGVGREWLIGTIVGAAAVVILLTVLATVLDRYLTDMKGFAEATLEGLLIVRDQKIIEANDRMAVLLGIQAEVLVGQAVDAVLVALDGKPLSAARDKPVEAAPRGGAGQRVFEVAVHAIEYRGRISDVLAVRDLTEAKTAQRRIEHLARHDGLTDLPNRTLLEERLEHALARAARTGEEVALVAVDLDRFKAVNDLFGHAEGDRVLKDVAEILRHCVRATDTVARIGGDEFAILQVGASQPEGAATLSDRILETFREVMNLSLDPTAVGASLGVAVYPMDADDAESLRHAADIALYKAKTSGRGAVAFFDAQMDIEARQRRQLENDLRHAVTRREFRLDYQPLVRSADGALCGYEALVRWNHPERGEVGPDDFIPLAEETGAILAIGEWVLMEACRAAAAWPAPLKVAVNISAVQFQVATLADVVAAALAASGLDAARLELEITETALLKDREAVIATLHRIKALGASIVMDDFGTGYSSLSNLQSFPFDKIKIDRSFIQSMEDDDAARSIIRAIVGIGRSLNLPVVAEGVETAEQRRLVIEEGCPEAQGFYFGRPGPGPTSDPVTQKTSSVA